MPAEKRRWLLFFCFATSMHSQDLQERHSLQDFPRGRSRLDENMWLYLPEVGKPIRITSMQSVVGGVFNNSDIMQLDFSAEYDIKSEKDEGAVLVLDLKANLLNNLCFGL